jgi:hypothetical protein
VLSSVFMRYVLLFTGVLGARVSRVSLDRTVGKARVVNQEGRYAKMELHAGKTGLHSN